MNYFRMLGIIFGLAAMLKPVYMHLLPWDENAFIARFYSEKRPPWIVAIAICGILLVVLTWVLHFSLNIANSIVITVLFSLTAIKGIVLLFDYQRFQRAVARMLRKDKGKDIVMIDVGVGAFGLALLLLTFYLY